MSITNEIIEEWLKSAPMKYKIPIYGIALGYEKYAVLKEELMAIQFNPSSPESRACGFDLGIRIALPGVDSHKQVYLCGYNFEGIHFLI